MAEPKGNFLLHLYPQVILQSKHENEWTLHYQCSREHGGQTNRTEMRIVMRLVQQYGII